MMAVIQVQSIVGTWREVGRCSNDATVIAKRLDEMQRRYKKPARAINDKTNALLDIRM
jgi:hypothetical protein